eukprot:5056434-Lingulodinium_polyedra.AAC.1
MGGIPEVGTCTNRAGVGWATGGARSSGRCRSGARREPCGAELCGQGWRRGFGRHAEPLVGQWKGCGGTCAVGPESAKA